MTRYLEFTSGNFLYDWATFYVGQYVFVQCFRVYSSRHSETRMVGLCANRSVHAIVVASQHCASIGAVDSIRMDKSSLFSVHTQCNIKKRRYYYQLVSKHHRANGELVGRARGREVMNQNEGWISVC